MAANTENRELALEINLEGEILKLGDEFTSNAAVELSGLGRHDEAIRKVSSMSMELERSYTVLGNILNNAGKKHEALENYLLAIEKDYNPVDVMFLYQILEWVGQLADHSELIGTQLELILARS